MAVNEEKYREIKEELKQNNVELVAVSKIQAVRDIQKMYDLGQRDFGENYVQELIEKQQLLPRDIRWHFIGHLQTNKVKYIAGIVHLIQGVDSLKLVKEINKQAQKLNKKINCLLQIHIAQEESKFGLDEKELQEIIDLVKSNTTEFSNIRICGLMGMASLTGDLMKVRHEMTKLKSLFEKYKRFSAENGELSILSMGMSGDYKIAVEEGSNMVRIGSLLFGERRPK